MLFSLIHFYEQVWVILNIIAESNICCPHDLSWPHFSSILPPSSCDNEVVWLEIDGFHLGPLQCSWPKEYHFPYILSAKVDFIHATKHDIKLFTHINSSTNSPYDPPSPWSVLTYGKDYGILGQFLLLLISDSKSSEEGPANLLFSCSVMSDSLWPHGLQHARLSCPSLSPRVCSHSCPSTQWCHLTISCSPTSFSSCPQSLSVSGSFPMSWLFMWGGSSSGTNLAKSSPPPVLWIKFLQ